MSIKEVEQYLHELNAKGNFALTSLTDVDGFSLITVKSPECCEPDIYAAVAARLQRTAEQARSHLGMVPVDEVSTTFEDGRRLVCRPFVANNQNLILSIVVSKKHSYRQLTNRAIRYIKHEWEV